LRRDERGCRSTTAGTVAADLSPHAAAGDAIRWLPTDDVRLEECRTAYDKGVVDPQDSWLVP